MAVAHSPSGFTGTVDQIDEARRFAVGGGGRFRVNSSTDWAITANSGSNRTVNIAAGMAAACGVLDVTTVTETLTFAANAGGTDRFDAVAASFDWATMTVAFRVIQGTTVPPVAVRTGTTVDLNNINWLPGIRYDAVIGIIRARPNVAILAPADLYDIRPWGAWNALNVLSTAFKDQVDIDQGGRIRESATGITWDRIGSAWVNPESIFNITAMDGSTVPAGAQIKHQRTSHVTTVTNAAGGFNVNLGVIYTKLMSVSISPGDAAAGLAFIVPIAGNHTTSTVAGQAFMSTGSGVANGSNIRVEVDVVGYQLPS